MSTPKPKKPRTGKSDPMKVIGAIQAAAVALTVAYKAVKPLVRKWKTRKRASREM